MSDDKQLKNPEKQLFCEHNSFDGETKIECLEHKRKYRVTLTIRCKDCDLPFNFRGLPTEWDPDGASVSKDGLTATLPIAPGVGGDIVPEEEEV